MTIGEMVLMMVPSDRLIIQDNTSKEIYRDYVANFSQSGIDTNRNVRLFGIATDIFKKKQETRILMNRDVKWSIPLDGISRFRFSDLEMLIFTKVVLDD